MLSAAQWDHLNSFSELRSNYYVRGEDISDSDVLQVKFIFIFPSTLPSSLFQLHGLKGDTSLFVYQEITSYFVFLVCEKKSAKEWLLTNWKSFQSYASYNDLASCWSSFDGVRNHFENRASFSCEASSNRGAGG